MAPMEKALHFPPQALRDYAFIADGERGALVGPRGEIAWMCAPRWDSDAVFGSLVGARGVYSVVPVGRFVWGGYYEPDSLIWRSRWVTGRGVVECREALALPADPDRVVLLRRVCAIDGDARLRVELEAHAGFGSSSFADLQRSDSIWTARTGSLCLRWQGASRARPSSGRSHRRLIMDLEVAAGDSHDLALEITEGELPDDPVDYELAWRQTETAWEKAVPELTDCLSPGEARHSYAVLRGMTCSTGGIVAAATTSLPERAETGRNYDYRYVWIRDQCYAGHAAAAARDVGLLADAVRFVTARVLEDGPRLAPAYTVAGTRVPDQYQLDLPGYPGGFDRVGNWVNQQFQLDAFGDALLLFAEAARAELVDADTWKAVEVVADSIAARWTEPDAGIWEIDNQPWTHSRLTAVAGLRAVSALPSMPGRAGEWLALADLIGADTAARAVHPDGHWQRSPGDPGLDGSLLLPALRGALSPADPRTLATLDAYRRRLTADGYSYRFRHDARPLSEAEGSFTLCGFLMAMATCQQQKWVEARAWWERSRASCGPARLYSEEYDTTERQMRGNLPQAFVHALMLESAAMLGSSPARADCDRAEVEMG
jgi:alpha,alpha-trehalase